MLLDVVAILESEPPCCWMTSDTLQLLPRTRMYEAATGPYSFRDYLAHTQAQEEAIDFYESGALWLLLDEARKKKEPKPTDTDYFRQIIKGFLSDDPADDADADDDAAVARAKSSVSTVRKRFIDNLKIWRTVAAKRKDPLDYLRRDISKRYKQGNLNRQKIIKSFPWSKTAQPRPGQMVSFFYDAKGKKTLPFWDKFPLIIFLEKQEGSFLGLNLHYLSPMMRQKFFKELLKKKSGNSLKITYGDLKGSQALRYYKPCIKRYLDDHVKSPFARVSSNYWNQVLFLPVSQFQKAKVNRVYNWAKSKL